MKGAAAKQLYPTGSVVGEIVGDSTACSKPIAYGQRLCLSHGPLETTVRALAPSDSTIVETIGEGIEYGVRQSCAEDRPILTLHRRLRRQVAHPLNRIASSRASRFLLPFLIALAYGSRAFAYSSVHPPVGSDSPNALSSTVSPDTVSEWTRSRLTKADEASQSQPICLDGSPYLVHLHRGTPQRLALILGGGGACWDFSTCWAARLATQQATNHVPNAGMLDVKNPANPIDDWTILFAPYCDGSVFSGDTTINYNDRLTYHHGRQNVSAAVSFVKTVTPSPELIAIAGTSAGAYGTSTAYRIVRAAFPNAQIRVVIDSGPGIDNPRDYKSRNLRLAHWRYDRHLPEGCDRCGDQPVFLWKWFLARDAGLSVLLLNYARDGVLSFFLRLDVVELESLIRKSTSSITTLYPDRFTVVIVPGSGHTFLLSPTFYVNTIQSTDTPADIIRGFLNRP